jgi:hypothetical protein
MTLSRSRWPSGKEALGQKLAKQEELEHEVFGGKTAANSTP